MSLQQEETTMHQNMIKKYSNSMQSLTLKNAGPSSLTEPAYLKKPNSSLWNITCAINPIVSAAAPALMTTNMLTTLQDQASPHLLYNALSQEIKIFEEKIRALDYRSAFVLAARYLLCSYIDETLLQNPLLKSVWETNPFLNAFQDETYGGERFFIILERASEDPKAHLELLELGFFLLNLGYQGKYAKPKSNPRELEHIKDNLYNIIIKHHADLDSPLFLTNQPDPTTIYSTSQKTRRISHLAFALGVLCIGLVTVYLPYRLHLRKLMTPILNTLNAAEKNNSIGIM